MLQLVGHAILLAGVFVVTLLIGWRAGALIGLAAAATIVLMVWLRALDALGGRITLLVVSHRPFVLERADQIVPLERGRRV